LLTGLRRAFKGLGGNPLRAIKNWWRGTPNLTKALRREALEDIPDSVHKAKVFSKSVDEAVLKSKNNLHKQVLRYRKETETAAAELRRHEAILQRYKRERADLSIPEYTDKLEPQALKHRLDELEFDIAEKNDAVAALRQNLKFVEKKHVQLKGAYVNLNRNPQQAVRQIRNDPHFAEDTELMIHLDEMAIPLATKQQILNSTSRHIGSDKKFVQEYLTVVRPYLKKGDDVGMYANNWMANPRNRTRLEELKQSRKMGKILRETEIGDKKTREALSDLGVGGLASKLKVGAGMAASLVIPVAIMSWFDDSAEGIQTGANQARVGLDGLSVSGEAKNIVERARVAFDDTQDAIGDANRGFGSDPGAAVEKYVARLMKNQKIIDQCVADWGVVISSSDDKDAATGVKQQLQNLSTKIATELAKVEKITNKGSDSGAGKTRTITKEKILGIQRFLRDQSIFKQRFTHIAPSGELDKSTIEAIRRVEQELNKLEKTDEFTGLLYDSSINHLVSAEDLKKLEDAVRNK